MGTRCLEVVRAPIRQHGEQPDRRSEREGWGGWLARLWVGRRMESDESKVLPLS